MVALAAGKVQPLARILSTPIRYLPVTNCIVVRVAPWRRQPRRGIRRYGRKVSISFYICGFVLDIGNIRVDLVHLLFEKSTRERA